MRASLSVLVDNLSEIKYKKCLDKKTIKNLIKKFPNTYRFCNGDIKKFVMLLRKGVYLYEYMDSWEKFNETSLPSKKDFYSELNLEDISDKDYKHAQKVFMFKQIHFYLLMFLKILEISALKYMGLIPHIFIQHLD